MENTDGCTYEFVFATSFACHSDEKEEASCDVFHVKSNSIIDLSALKGQHFQVGYETFNPLILLKIALLQELATDSANRRCNTPKLMSILSVPPIVQIDFS